MSWDTIIRLREGEHAEFWSAELGTNGYTGHVNYGKLGGTARSYNFGSDMAVRDKIRDKLNEGYVKVNGVQTGPSPSYFTVMSTLRRAGWTRANVNQVLLERGVFVLQVRQDINGGDREITEETESEPEPQPEPPSPVQRARERIERARPRTNTRTDETFEIKTGRDGGITKYRQGYTPKRFSKVIEQTKIMLLRDLIINSRETTALASAKQYYERIPASMLWDKPPRLEDLRQRERPTAMVVFDTQRRTKEAIGIIAINRRTGLCDFFVIKTNAENRKSLFAFLMRRIATSVDDRATQKITFKIKHAPTRKTIKELAPFFTSSTSNSLVYDITALRQGIQGPVAKPERWLE